MQEGAGTEFYKNCRGVEEADDRKAHTKIPFVYASNRIVTKR